MVFLSVSPTGAAGPPSPAAESEADEQRIRDTDARLPAGIINSSSSSNPTPTPSPSNPTNRLQQRHFMRFYGHQRQEDASPRAASNPRAATSSPAPSKLNPAHGWNEKSASSLLLSSSICAVTIDDRGPDMGGGPGGGGSPPRGGMGVRVGASGIRSGSSSSSRNRGARGAGDGLPGRVDRGESRIGLGLLEEVQEGGAVGLVAGGGYNGGTAPEGAQEEEGGGGGGGGGGGRPGRGRAGGGIGGIVLSSGESSDNSDNSLGAGMTEPKGGGGVPGLPRPPPPRLRAPSACSTPDLGSPRLPGASGAGDDVFVSPMGSPWPPGGPGSAGGGVGVGQAGGSALGGPFSRGNVQRPWKAGGKASDGAAHGDAAAMSPISMAACSTPRTVTSPRATLTTPRAVAAAASAVNSVNAASSTANGWGRSMRSFSAGIDCDSTAAASWWSELDLSPPRLDYPDGLQKWRDARKPAYTSASATTGSTGTTNTTSTRSDSPPSTSPERHSAATPTTLRYNNYQYNSQQQQQQQHQIMSSSSRLTRSYVTLLASAAAAASGSGSGYAPAEGESRARSSSVGREGGAGGLGFGVGRGRSGVRGVRRGADGSASAGGGGAGSSSSHVAEEAQAREERLRQLEAENLRLRFRVADLEGQVSVMEDELDLRGRRGGGMETPAPSGAAGAAAAGAASATSSVPERAYEIEAVGPGDSDGAEGDSGAGTVEDGPLLSPRGRGYLARLVLEVCSEIEEGKKKAAVAKSAVTNSAAIPKSERLCKVLPKVMEAAIRGVKDLDEQVFEQMMQTASERTPQHAPHPLPQQAPPSLGTPARRLSSCVVARDGSTEFFAQSPAPSGRHSFFRGMNGGGGSCRSSNTRSTAANEVPRPTSMKESSFGGKGMLGRGGRGAEAPVPQSLASNASASAANSQGGATERPAKHVGFLGAGDWITKAFTPRGGGSANASGGGGGGGGGGGAFETDISSILSSPRAPTTSNKGDSSSVLTPAQSQETQDMLSFEGSTEEVLRYTIVAKSYLIRSRSKRREDGSSSPGGVPRSPRVSRQALEGDNDDVRDATKELLDLKNRYMSATQHWLKTDIVSDEELRTIRAQVFEAIQRKRSELHREAAAVLRAERAIEVRRGTSQSPKRRGARPTTPKRDRPPGDRGASASSRGSSASKEEEEAARTISMLSGTAELLRFSRLLLLLSEAISVSSSAGSSTHGGGRGETSEVKHMPAPSLPPPPPSSSQYSYSYSAAPQLSAPSSSFRRHSLLISRGGDFLGASPSTRPPLRSGTSGMTTPLRHAPAKGSEGDSSPE